MKSYYNVPNNENISKTCNLQQKFNFTSKIPISKIFNKININNKNNINSKPLNIDKSISSYHTKNNINNDINNQYKTHNQNKNFNKKATNKYKSFYKRFSSKKNTQSNNRFYKGKYHSNNNHKSYSNSSKQFITNFLIIPVGGTLTIKIIYHYGQKLREDNLSNCSTIYCEARYRNKGSRGKNLVIALEEKKINEEIEGIFSF